MKKLFIILFTLLVFTACAAKEEALPDEFDADISITADGCVYGALYEKRLDSDKLKLLSPESLCGVEFLLRDGVCTVTLGDTSFECEGLLAVFDFLPVYKEETKTVGTREYRIYGLRGIE